MERVARIAGAQLLRLVSFVLLFATALVLHLPTRLGRSAAADIARTLVAQLVPGHLTLGAVTRLDLSGVTVRGVGWSDLDGRPVVRGATVAVNDLVSVLGAAIAGTPWPRIDVDAPDVVVFTPRLPPPDPRAAASSASAAPWTLRLDDVRVRVGTVRNTLGFPVDLGGVVLRGAVTAGSGGVDVDVRELLLQATSTVLRGTSLAATAHVATTRFLDVEGDLALRGAPVRCHAVAGPRAHRTVGLTLSDCFVPGSTIAQLAGVAPGTFVPDVAVPHLSAVGSLEGPWSFDGALRVGGAALTFDAALGARERTVRLRFEDTSLRDAMPSLPDARLDGVISLRDEVLADGDRFTVDAQEFRGTPHGARLPAILRHREIPSFTASVRVPTRGAVELEHFDVPALRLHATGEIGRDAPHHLHARATFDPPPLEELPWTAGGGTGRVRGHVEAHGDLGHLALSAEVAATSVTWHGVRVAQATVRASARVEGGVRDVHATASIRGAGVGSTVRASDADVEVHGDPTRGFDVRGAVRGGGLLASLGAAPAGSVDRAGVTLAAHLGVREDGHVATRVDTLDLDLRGARAHIRGSIALHPDRPIASLRGDVHIDAGSSGTLEVRMDDGRLAVRAAHFDLGWAAPLVRTPVPLSGRIDGDLALDVAHPGASSGHLTVAGLALDALGTVTGVVNVRDRAGEMNAEIAGTLAPRGGGEPATLHASLSTPRLRRLDDADEWIDVVRHAELRVEVPELETFGPLRASVPRPFGARGRVVLLAGAHRTREGEPLEVFAAVEGRSVVAGVETPRLLGRPPGLLPAVQPMWVRAVACAGLRSSDPDEIVPRVRFAVMRDFGEVSSGPPERCDDQPLMARSWVAGDVAVRGPWATAAGMVADELADLATVQLDAENLAAFEGTHVDGTVTLGPMLRSEWPLRTIALPRAGGAPRFIRPPDVPLGTMVSAEVRAHGTVLHPRLEVEATGIAPSLPAVGVNEVFQVDLAGSIGPRAGGTVVDPWVLSIGGRAITSPNAPRDQQARVETDLRLSARPQDVAARGADALSWDRFDIDSENLRLERVQALRERGLAGLLAMHFQATQDPTHPVTAELTLEDFRAELPQGLRGVVAAPTARARARAAIVHAGSSFRLRTCAVATTASAIPDCAADEDSIVAPPQTFLLRASAPITGTFPRFQFDPAGASVDLAASAYALDTLSELVPEDVASDLGGTLDAEVHWEGAHPTTPRGHVALHGGRATVTALGEPMHGLELDLTADGGSMQLRRFDFDLGRGSLRAAGEVDLGAEATEMTLRGTTRALPAVVSGYTWAWLDGSIGVTATLTGDGLRGAVTVDQLAAYVQDQPPNDVQSLDAEPAVFVVGRTRLAQPGAASHFAVDLTFRSQAPVWARRSDFAVALRTDLRIHRDRSGTAITGVIAQASTQCWYSLFGKQFDLDRIEITFDGNVDVNPVLDIVAHHDSPSGRITITVGGRLDHPSIIFASENFPTATQSEVLAMIALGRRSPAATSSATDFAEQFAQAVVSLVSGMVASGLSRQFAFLPTIIAEPTLTGTGGRYGAGVNLSPRLYLQATYALGDSGADSASGLGPEFRMMLEYVVTSAVTMAVSGSSRGEAAADVFWSP